MASEKKLPAGTAYAPADWQDADVLALQAIFDGRADAAQQRRALDWIVYHCARTTDFHYHATERDTAFALGRAFVGQQIGKLLKINATKLMQRGGKPDVET